MDVSLFNQESCLVISSLDLEFFFGGVANDLELLMQGKGTLFAYNVVRVDSLMISSDIVECNIVADLKAPLLGCSLFISKLKSGDTITSGQHMKYQTLSILQFRRSREISSHSIQTVLRETSGEENPFVSLGISRLVLMFRKYLIFICD